MADRGQGPLEAYEEGVIAQRLAAATRRVSEKTPIERYRRAAAVLSHFDPTTLHPVGGGSEDSQISGLDLLPDLVQAPPPFGDLGLWTLIDSERRWTLETMATRQAMRAALDANPDRPDNPTQCVFERIVRSNRALALEDFDDEELEALTTVLGWLQGTFDDLPDPEEVGRQLAGYRSLALLGELADLHFHGRDTELAMVLKHVSSRRPEILFVAGSGGSGKSALLSRFLLDWAVDDSNGKLRSFRPWVRIDLDSPESDPQRPSSLLTTAISQLATQVPDLEQRATKLRDFSLHRGRGVDSLTPEDSPRSLTDEKDDALFQWQVFCQEVNSRLSGGLFPLLMAIDTFEEVQFFGKEIEKRFLDLFGELATSTPGIRLVILGRTRPRFSTAAGARLIVQPLGDLSQASARKVLTGLVGESAPADHEVISEVVGRVGRNPLTLRLAAPLIVRSGRTLLEDEELMGELESSAIQARLYSRILAHIHDPDLNRLAVPGLVVRLITPELIQAVLAEPCGLEELDEGRASLLFEKLRKEVALVSVEDEMGLPGALRHRPDVRQVMLRAMPGQYAEKIHAIDQRAVSFWASKDGDIARAEEIYHRLRLRQDLAKVEDRWFDEVGKYLGTALDELEPGTRERAWLARKLGATLAEEERDLVPHAEWEQHAARSALRWLGSGQPHRALEVLGERIERSEASPLFALEARAHLLNGDLLLAGDVAARAIESTDPTLHPEARLELEFLLSTVHERSGDFEAAARVLQRSQRWQERVDVQSPLRLRTEIRQLGVRRRGGLKAPSSQVLRRLAALADRIQHVYWSERPAVLRETVAEIGEVWIEGLALAFGRFGLDTLATVSRRELLNLLQMADAIDESRLTRIAAGREDELRQLASGVLGDALYGDASSAKRVRMALVAALRRDQDRPRLGKYQQPTGLKAPKVDADLDRSQETPNDSELHELEHLLKSNFGRKQIAELAEFYLGENVSPRKATAKWLVNQAARTGKLGELVGATNHVLGAAALDLGDYDQAGEWYRKSLVEKERLGDQDGIADVLLQLGRIAQAQGNFEEAQDQFRQLLAIYEAQGDHSGMEISYHQLGLVAQDRQGYDEAQNWHQKSLAMSRELENRSGMATSYYQLGSIAQLRGDFDKAETMYRRTLDIAEELDDRYSMAISYHQLGSIAQLRGDFDKAETMYRKALRFAESSGNPSGMEAIYHQLGNIAQLRGDFDEAEEIYRRAVVIAEDLENRSGLAASYYQLGSIAQLRSDFDKAETMYRRVLEIAESLGNLSSMEATYHQLGSIAQLRDDFDKAETMNRRSLEIAEELGNRSGMVTSYDQLGRLAQQRDRYDEAESWYRAALETAEESGDRSGTVNPLSSLGFLLTEKGAPREAVPLTLRSVIARIELQEPQKLLDVRQLLRQEDLLGAEDFRMLLVGELGAERAAQLIEQLNALRARSFGVGDT